MQCQPSSENVLLDLKVEEVAGELLLEVGGVSDVELDPELKSQHVRTCGGGEGRSEGGRGGGGREGRSE